MAISRLHNNPKGREETEWANFWYSVANREEKGKILLIGDSNGRKIRSILEYMSGKHVDFFGTSAGLHDMLFHSQLQAFFSTISEFYYDYIYVWVGYHSLINDEGDKYGDEDYIKFENDIIKLIDILRCYSTSIILCSALFPVIKKDHQNLIDRIWFHLKPLCRMFKENIDWNDSSVIEKKNQVLEEIANKTDLMFCDINNYMLGRSQRYKTRCVHYDRIHYEGKAYPYIVRLMLECIKK